MNRKHGVPDALGKVLVDAMRKLQQREHKMKGKSMELKSHPPLLQENSLRGLVRQLSIDQLDNEGRRVGVYDNKEKSPLFARSLSQPVRSG